MRVREAGADEMATVRAVLDGALLDVDQELLGDALARGDVLVATADGRVLGTAVLDGGELVAVAVRRRRRDQGIGTALVEAAADRRDRLVAGFDDRVRPFYESLGFDVEPAAEPGRFRGTRHSDG